MIPEKSKNIEKLNRINAFKAEAGRWAEKIKVKPRQLRIQAMKNKWASCSSQGRVCFNTDLLEEPGDFQQYVIVHELLHLKIPNHGGLFKSLMSAYLPDWKNILERRKNNKPESVVYGMSIAG